MNTTMRTLPVVLALIASTFVAAQTDSQQGSGVGFKTVAEAMASLKNKPDVAITTRSNDQWIIINEKGGQTNWSFIRESHYALPAVVKREIRVDSEGKLIMQTRALCESGKGPCECLMGEFNETNRRAYENTQKP